jgi:hypothetical protein
MAAKKIKLSDTMKKDIKPSESDQVIKQSDQVLTMDKRIESICERFDQDSGDYRYPKVGSYSGFISGFQNPSKSISSCILLFPCRRQAALLMGYSLMRCGQRASPSRLSPTSRKSSR